MRRGFLDNLFKHPYTKIEYLVRDLRVTRQTATKYLNKLIEIGLLEKHKIGKENYYIHPALLELLGNIPELK